MALLDLGFEWPVDDGGYEIAAAEKATRSKGRRALLLDSGKPQRIVRKGGSIRWARPLEFHPKLYLDFALLDQRPEAYTKFAASFGFLGLGLGMGWARDKEELVNELDEESVSEWRAAIKDMLHAIGLWETNPRLLTHGRHQVQITRLDALLVPSPPDGKPALRMRPRSLLGAMYLQFAQAVSSGLDIRTCEQCGKLFEAGGDRRRRDARFCSDTCRVNHHNQRKRS